MQRESDMPEVYSQLAMRTARRASWGSRPSLSQQPARGA